jgi:glycosyltransferase involved in cell wall biosynthesis
MKVDLVTNFNIPEKKITVINNPVDFSLLPSVAPNPPDASEVINLVSVGQLRREKGYERVIQALALCPHSYRYQIIGGGNPDKLNNLIQSLGVAHKISLLGAMPNPYTILAKSDCLLLGSYYEGFPNVVLEANACGIPVIAFRAPGGHNEIIVQGINGWFIDSPGELCSLLERKAYKNLDRDQIISMTRKRYALEKIIGQYENEILNHFALSTGK